MADETNEPRKMLSMQEVLNIVPFCEKTIYRMQRLGKFPRSHPFFPGSSNARGQKRFWYADEIAEWQRTLEDEY